MPALGEYSNVYNTAFLILQKKGFQVWYDEQLDQYFAEREGWDFQSPTPCGLLGLVAIFEYKQPAGFRDYWWREEGPDVYRNLPDHPSKGYVPIWMK